jgi:hypothetical protein
MSLKIFFSKELGEQFMSIPKVQNVSAAANTYTARPTSTFV